MEKKEILREIYKIPFWRQKIELEPGIYTPGSTVFPELWEMMKLPANLEGKSFLDVGANDGLFSFLAEEKGAKRTVAVDIYNDISQSSSMTEGWSSKCIELVKKYKSSTIEIKSNSLYDLENWNEKFDYVFCSNVVIWLDDIYKAHKILSELTKSTLIIREDIFLGGGDAELRFSKLHEKNPDKAHLIGNKAYYEKVLKKFGFSSIEFIDIREDIIWNEYTKKNGLYELKKGTEIFESFDTQHRVQLLAENTTKSLSVELNNRFYFRGIGWVEKNNVQRLSDLSASIFRLNISRLWKRLQSKSHEANYVIIAKRD